MRTFLIILCCSVLFADAFHIGFQQSARVHGRLVCHGQPMRKTLVKLYDNDRGIDSDDLMASGETDMNGYFTLEGHTAEFFTIDPKLNIYHRCGSQEKKNFLKKILMIKKICPKKLTFWVPKEYVSRGKHAARTYEFGTLEMSLKYKHSKTDCFH